MNGKKAIPILFLLILFAANYCSAVITFGDGTCAYSCILKANVSLPFCGDYIKYDTLCAPLNSTAQLLDLSAKYAYTNISTDISQNSDACQANAKIFICGMFFPRCNATSMVQYGMCQSTCYNYYSSCGSKELVDFRCLSDPAYADKKWGVFKGQFGVDLCTGSVSQGPRFASLGVILPLLLLIALWFV